METSTTEYSVIANCEGGRQLTASGYKLFEHVHAAIADRVKHGRSGIYRPTGFVVIRGDGKVAEFDAMGRPVRSSMPIVMAFYSAEIVDQAVAS